MKSDSLSTASATGASVPRFAANLDAAVIHRVLLTDPSDVTSLTLSGGKSRSTATPSFREFSESLSQERAHAEMTIKRAVRDHVVDTVYQTRQIDPLRNLLLHELHPKLRALVPNRIDLHGTLQAHSALNMRTPFEALPPIVDAAEALRQLESDARSETTQAWLEDAQCMDTARMDLKPLIEYLVTSLLYLLFKAELCDQDKQDFYLWTVWAPQIRSEGYQYERDTFESRFGTMSDPQTAPLTRHWIESLVKQLPQSSRDELMLSDQHTALREQLVKRGWVENILFRSLEQSTLALPEILSLDLENLNELRDVTRRAAAGSALALHCCNAAGVSSALLSEEMDSSSVVTLRQKGISDAMANRQASTTIEEYEEAVSSQVVALAREFNGALGEETASMLRSRTASVLKAEDPVIKLLNGRMKEVFTALVARPASSVPTDIRTGTVYVGMSVSSSFREEAEAEFRKRGLSFYSVELSNACLLSRKVIDLAWKLFGEAILDRLILEACENIDGNS